MYWENPSLLFGLWVLPVLAGLLVYAQRRRAAAARQFVEPEMVARLLPPYAASRTWVKGIGLVLGVACLLLAAARPRWGVYFERVSARGVDLFVLLDVSKSMLAQDVAPNRLEHAKSDITDLLKRLQGDRVGLVVFAGAAIVKVPLTTDQGFFRSALAEVDTDSAPRGGSLIGDAIRKALVSMPVQPDRDQVLVLITDGEDHDSFPEEAAKQAAERKVKIITVGLGDPREGSRIPVRDAQGNQHFLKHEGQEVWSRMDERLLKEIALSTGGAYVPAQTRAYDLGQIYDDQLSQLTRGEIRAEKRKRYGEQFQLFLGLGLMLLMIDVAVPRHPRRRSGSA
jgi:Ca-activated chloride channel homolog